MIFESLATWGRSSLFKFEGSWIDFLAEVIKVPVPQFEPGKLVVDETQECTSIQRVRELRRLRKHAGKEVNVLHIVINLLQVSDVLRTVCGAQILESMKL